MTAAVVMTVTLETVEGDMTTDAGRDRLMVALKAVMP